MKPNNIRKTKSKMQKTRGQNKTQNRKSRNRSRNKNRSREWISATEAAKNKLLKTGSIVDAKRALIEQKLHNVYSLFGSN